ncbi:Rieske (2Fe-2S) protein [Flavipsychrobacter stenotrophus]|nr:Rieske (2Fe-2S) protein [Flavipsychrobacter stenotrophus]
MLYTFHKTTATLASLAEDKPTETTTGAKKVCLLKRADKIFAFAALCPHSGAPMCDGWVDPLGRVVCPLHKYRFDPANGRNTSGEGYKMTTFPVEIRDGAIYVGLLNTLWQAENERLNTDLNARDKDKDDDIDRW